MAANNSNKLVIKRNQLYVPGNVSVKSGSIERHEPCVFKIENHVNKTTGSGFLCKIKIMVGEQQRYLVGMMTCAHVMPDVCDDNLKPLENYTITFERGVNSREAARQLSECVLRAIKMDELDALFLIVKESTEQFWTKNLRVKDVIDTTRNNIYTKDRLFFSMGHPRGGQLHVGTGNIGSQTDTDVLVSHNMSTDDGNSGAPIIDLLTEKFIAIHKGVLDLSQNTHEDKDNYPNCAVKIIPVIKCIEEYFYKRLGQSYLYTTNEGEAENDLDCATIKYPDDIDAATESTIKNVYHETFSANAGLIAQNINFGVKYNTIPRLIGAGVLEQGRNAHMDIVRRGSDKDKGDELVKYLISENNILKYDAFIVTWSDVLKIKENRQNGSKNQAEMFRDEIDRKLKAGAIHPQNFAGR